MMRQFEADVSKWGVALMQPPDSTATVGDNKGGVVPLKPDYADNKAWIAAPQLGFNPSCNVPLPATRPGIYAHTTPVPEAAIPAALDLEEAAADVFFLTPTSKYFQAGEKGWNADAYDGTSITNSSPAPGAARNCAHILRCRCWLMSAPMVERCRVWAQK